MVTIHKHKLEAAPLTTLALPEGAHILHVGMQENELFFWALVDSQKPRTHRVIEVVGTGWNLPPVPRHYIGSVHTPSGYVWHFFELTSLTTPPA